MKCLIHTEQELSPAFNEFSFYCSRCNGDEYYNFFYNAYSEDKCSKEARIVMDINDYRLCYKINDSSESYLYKRRNKESKILLDLPANLHITHTYDQIVKLIEEYLIFS
jgi:hypothetical protein